MQVNLNNTPSLGPLSEEDADEAIRESWPARRMDASDVQRYRESEGDSLPDSGDYGDHDHAPEMLGRMLLYAVAVVLGAALIAACWPAA
jgi:hypothetical protein